MAGYRQPLLSRDCTEVDTAKGMVAHTQFKINSLAPGRSGSNFDKVISANMAWIYFMNTSCEIALMWMPLDIFNDMSTLVQVMV